MSSWARVGAKCVCVDDDVKSYAHLGGSTHHGVLIEKGQTYVVREVAEGYGVPTVKLAGVADRAPSDEGYAVARFRPVVPPQVKTQADDIALIKSLLTPAPELVE